MRPERRIARGATVFVAVVHLAACMTARPPERRWMSPEACHFVVLNATAMALEIRRFEQRSVPAIGTLNPSEQLSDSASCAEGQVFIAGVPLPRQVGVPAGRLVYGSVELVAGRRTHLTLYWP